MKSFLKLFFIFFLCNSASIVIASAAQVDSHDLDDADDDQDYSEDFSDASENPAADQLNSSASSNNHNVSGANDHSDSLNASSSSSHAGSAQNLNDITGVSVEDVTDRDDDNYLSDDENFGGDSSGASSGNNSPAADIAIKLNSQPTTSTVNTSNGIATGNIPLGAAAAHSSANNQASTSGVGLQSNGHSAEASSTHTNSNGVNAGHSASAKAGVSDHAIDAKHIASMVNQATNKTLDYDQPATTNTNSDPTTAADTTNNGNSNNSQNNVPNSQNTTQQQKEAEYAKNASNSFFNKIKEGLMAKPYLTGLAAAAAISTIFYKYNATVRKKVDNAIKTAKDKAQKTYLQFSQYANRPFKVSSALKLGAICGVVYIGYKSGLPDACSSMWKDGFWNRDPKEKLLIGSSIVATGISAALIYNAIKNRKNKNKEKVA